MAATYSFDVTSTIEMPEVDNAVNQAKKEIGQRFDFKGSTATIELDQKASTLTLSAEDNFKLESVWDVLQTRLIKRNVAVKNLKRGDIEPASGSTVKQVITLQQGIPIEAAKDIVKHLKELKLKVQAGIQGEQVRITSGSKDTCRTRCRRCARRILEWRCSLGTTARTAAARTPGPRPTVSLERALSKLGLASRSQARELILQGRVRVAGQVVTTPAMRLVPEGVAIAIDGVVPDTAAPLTIVLHKPRGYVTTRSDPEGRKTVYDLLDDLPGRVVPVGRLDLATSGLLLLTNDTQLANWLTDPDSAVERVYLVTVEGKVTDETAATTGQRRAGLTTRGWRPRPRPFGSRRSVRAI